jgi:2-oxoglutarate ferredoxin oxidoreductase subunit beta
MSTTTPTFSRPGVKPVWCPGCGDYGVLSALKKSLKELKIAPEELMIISGIGCSGRFSHYMDSYALHGTHGRALPTATGAKAVRPELTVLAVGGDGDGLSIGGGHISHAARRNTDLTYLLLDNHIYGLTKGQTSPTTPQGYQGITSPYGVAEEEMEPLPVFLTYGVSFIARGHSFDLPQLTDIITRAIRHPGFSIVYVHSPCVTHPSISWEALRERTKPLPEGFPTDDVMTALPYAYSRDPLYTGVLYQKRKPTLQERLKEVEKRACKDTGGEPLDASVRQIMQRFR